MSDVQRFIPCDQYTGMEPYKHGNYVLYKDYAELEGLYLNMMRDKLAPYITTLPKGQFEAFAAAVSRAEKIKADEVAG